VVLGEQPPAQITPAVTERVVMATGIGGQGVQLASNVLAHAAMAEGREVLLFGSYGGMMRGGNTDANVVVSDALVTAPPTVSRFWGAVGMHPEHWAKLQTRLRPGGVALIDVGVFRAPVVIEGCTVIEVDATECATAADAPRAATLCALAAFAAATGLVGKDALQRAAASTLPDYRRQHIAANARAIDLGFELVTPGTAPAWERSAV
jgi:Pyruvate/2-oxoacid:ferredoxin oxidoreductase gamma subunit